MDRERFAVNNVDRMETLGLPNLKTKHVNSTKQQTNSGEAL